MGIGFTIFLNLFDLMKICLPLPVFRCWTFYDIDPDCSQDPINATNQVLFCFIWRCKLPESFFFGKNKNKKTLLLTDSLFSFDCHLPGLRVISLVSPSQKQTKKVLSSLISVPRKRPPCISEIQGQGTVGGN